MHDFFENKSLWNAPVFGNLAVLSRLSHPEPRFTDRDPKKNQYQLFIIEIIFIFYLISWHVLCR